MPKPTPKTMRTSLLCGAALLVALPAPAQTAPPATGLENVIVTAQKRKERLQDVPLAITAFSGKELQAEHVTQPIDLASHTANLTVKNAVGDTNPIFAIRGVGLNDFATNGTQPVGAYVDDVYLVNNSQLSFQIMDMERVEVLKGPQGTLYGRNTTGGAVDFITNKPAAAFSAGLSTTIGSYGLLSTDAYVNEPITDKLYGRFSFSGERQFDGYFTNDLTGKHWGQTRRVAGRGQLLYQNDDTNVLVNLHAGLDRSDDWYYKYIADASGLPLGQMLQSIANSSNPDIFHGEHTDSPQPYIHNQSDGATVTVEHYFDFAALKSISSVEQLISARSEDYGSVPAPDGWNRYAGHLGTFSEELRLTSSGDGWWKWLVGGFVGHDRLNEDDTYNEIANPIYQGYVFAEKYIQNTTSLAMFVNNVIELAPNLHLTLGGRFTDEERHYDGGTTVLQSVPALAFDSCPCLTDKKLYYAVPTGKAGLDYRWNNILFYASASDGYKAGGITGFYITDVGALKPYMPEFVNAYEGGFKSDWMDGKLRLNGTVFYYDYRDLQAFGVIDNEFRIFNVTKSRIDGSEIQVDVLPFKGLEINSNLGLLNTRVLQSDVGGVAVGNSLGNAPKLEWDNTVTYSYPVSDTLTGFVALDYSYRGSTYYYVQNTPLQRQEGYWLWNPRFGVHAPNDKWSASFYVLNAGNRHYFREIFNDGGSVIGFPAPPLTFGFTFAYHWS